MANLVRGTLFVEYVRMMRSRPEVDWNAHLDPADQEYLSRRIYEGDWYPMETFERLGVAILREIAQGDLEAVRAWGRASVPNLRDHNLVVPGDPLASIMRFQVYRSDFFNFTAVEFNTLVTGRASVRIGYCMGDVAEEAACHQTVGFFETLIEAAGGQQCRATFLSRTWRGDAVTVVALEWA